MLGGGFLQVPGLGVLDTNTAMYRFLFKQQINYNPTTINYNLKIDLHIKTQVPVCRSDIALMNKDTTNSTCPLYQIYKRGKIKA